jgi:hypothetical protein
MSLILRWNLLNCLQFGIFEGFMIAPVANRNSRCDFALAELPTIVGGFWFLNPRHELGDTLATDSFPEQTFSLTN